MESDLVSFYFVLHLGKSRTTVRRRLDGIERMVPLCCEVDATVGAGAKATFGCFDVIGTSTVLG